MKVYFRILSTLELDSNMLNFGQVKHLNYSYIFIFSLTSNRFFYFCVFELLIIYLFCEKSFLFGRLEFLERKCIMFQINETTLLCFSHFSAAKNIRLQKRAKNKTLKISLRPEFDYIFL
jgi:hypothetical protein